MKIIHHEYIIKFLLKNHNSGKRIVKSMVVNYLTKTHRDWKGKDVYPVGKQKAKTITEEYIDKITELNEKLNKAS